LRIEELERDGYDPTAAIALLNGVTETLIIHQEYLQRVATRLEQGDEPRGTALIYVKAIAVALLYLPPLFGSSASRMIIMPPSERR
jgi:hypothetical protein